MRVLLLSGDVHCGKTTLLTGWCRRALASGAAVEGVLAGPDDAEGRRHLTALPSFESRRLQLGAGEQPATPETRTVVVGAYTMLADTVEWARGLVREPLREGARCPACSLGPRDCVCRTRYIVLDEIGPLELRRNEGLEPAVSELFARLATGAVLRNTTVIAVVRSPCVEEFIARYRIPEVQPFVKSPDWLRYSAGVEVQFPYRPAH